MFFNLIVTVMYVSREKKIVLQYYYKNCGLFSLTNLSSGLYLHIQQLCDKRYDEILKPVWCQKYGAEVYSHKFLYLCSSFYAKTHITEVKPCLLYEKIKTSLPLETRT